MQPLSFLASPGGQSGRLPMVFVDDEVEPSLVDVLPLVVPEPLVPLVLVLEPGR